MKRNATAEETTGEGEKQEAESVPPEKRMRKEVVKKHPQTKRYVLQVTLGDIVIDCI